MHHPNTRTLAGKTIHPIGLGCMPLSHAYGTPPSADQATRLLNQALDLGYNFFDSAALYGFGENERLLGQTLKFRRQEYVLASKGGLFGVADANGKMQRKMDNRSLQQQCEDSLKRLQTEVIDLYYLHRWDQKTPIEDCIEALSKLVQAGKIKAIGLSEVSAKTLARAHAVHPIAAVQSEYSLWTRNPEIAVLQFCEQQHIALVAFSPVGRGFLSNSPPNPKSFVTGDIRLSMPRFAPEQYPHNLAQQQLAQTLAEQQGCSLAQLALAWLLHQSPAIIAIPGTTRLEHLAENVTSDKVVLTQETIARLSTIFARENIAGERYNAHTQKEIDSEEF